MIKSIVGHACQFFYFLCIESAEITHLITEFNIMLFIAGLFGCMGSEYQPLFYFVDILIIFIIKVKCSRYGMGFIEMIDFRIKTKFIQQFGATYTQQDELRHFGSNICIV